MASSIEELQDEYLDSLIFKTNLTTKLGALLMMVARLDSEAIAKKLEKLAEDIRAGKVHN